MIKCVGFLVIAVAIAPAAADVPTSLRMRPRVAQAKLPQAAPIEDDQTEVISVSGTTVERELFTGRAPVSVVTRAELATAGRSTLGDILQALPAQSNAANAQVNQGGDGTSRISLRGLGAARTLVLLNGRRMVNGGAGADASVDLDAVPLPMVERVEIQKDGASVLYGADAVGGVVNLVTRRPFDGFDISLLSGTSQHGDSTEYDVSAVGGVTANDKHSYLIASAGFQGHDPVLASDRDFSAFQRSYDFASRTERRFLSEVTPDGRLDLSKLGPGQTATRPAGCASDLCRSDRAGGWTDFVSPGDSYNDATGNYLYTPSSRYNVFATAGNRLTDNAAITLEVMYLHRNSSRQLSPVKFVADAPISKDSLYNPFGADLLDYRRRITELGPRQFIDDATVRRYILGVTGSVPKGRALAGWKYELSFNHGDSKTVAKTTGQLYRPHVADSLGPSMLDSHGVPICVRRPGDASSQIIYHRVGLGDVACVPIDLLAPTGAIPRDPLSTLTYEDAGIGIDGMRAVHTAAAGPITELPNHGAISLSVGGDYRTEVGDQRPPEVAATSDSSDTATRPTNGRFDIYESYGELVVVPISGHPLARWVELDLGARALKHSEFGSSLTYKAGGLVRTVQGLSLRATYATASRAPSVRDTLGGLVDRDPAAEDPCDATPPSAGDAGRTLAPEIQARCTAQGVPVDSAFNTTQQRARIGGNPELKAETAATATVGLVYEPPQIRGLAVSADLWRVAIDHAIEALGAQTILANCYERGLDEFCGQIERDVFTHRILRIDQRLQNVRRTVTSGVDLALHHELRSAAIGQLQTALEGQYLLRYDLDTSSGAIHGVGVYDLGVYPRLKANLSSMWTHPGGPSAGFTLRFVGSYKECAGNSCYSDAKLATAHDVDRYFKLDLFGGYDFGSRIGKTTLQVGVNNVFDRTPPIVYNAPAANSDPTTYDFVGRVVFVRLSQRY